MTFIVPAGGYARSALYPGYDSAEYKGMNWTAGSTVRLVVDKSSPYFSAPRAKVNGTGTTMLVTWPGGIDRELFQLETARAGSSLRFQWGDSSEQVEDQDPTSIWLDFVPSGFAVIVR